MRKWQKTYYFRPNFGLLGPNLDPQSFFRGFYLYYMLDIVASYHRIQFQVKRLIQIQENCEKSHFWSDLGLLRPNSGRHFFF